jgi:putative salt-induced outer membrane protein
LEALVSRHIVIAAIALYWFLLSTTTLLAQPPSQPDQPPPPPPPREGSVEFSFVGTTGNAPTSAIGVGGEYILRPNPWLFRARANYVRNESEGELRAEAVKTLFRAGRILTDRLSLFGEHGYLHDQFAGIDARHTLDGGVTIAVVRPQPHQFDIDVGVGYAHEARVVGDTLSTAQALTGARYKVVVSQTAEFTNDLTFSFSFSDADDWRTANAAALIVKVTSLLSLKVSNIIRYVNAPVAEFETTDTLTSVSLVAKF